MTELEELQADIDATYAAARDAFTARAAARDEAYAAAYAADDALTDAAAALVVAELKKTKDYTK